jgi:hypothetical protein
MGFDLSWMTTIIPNIVDGGSAVIILLFMGLTWMVREYWKLQNHVAKQDDRLDKIMDDYHNAIINSAEALHKVEMVLNEIRWRCKQ